MIETLKNLYTTLIEASLQRKSKSLLSTFDKTVKGLENVGVKAQELAGLKADQIVSKEEATATRIAKVKAAERKAIIKAEMKRLTKVGKADDSLTKAKLTKTAQISSLTLIAEKNARVASKLKDLIA